MNTAQTLITRAGRAAAVLFHVGKEQTDDLWCDIVDGQAIDRFVASYDVGLLWDDLTDLKKELDSNTNMQFFAAGSAGVTSVLSVGYVLWTIRSGLLVTSLLAQMPAWRLVDPLVVLDYLNDEESNQTGNKDDEDDSLESMLERQETGADEPSEAGKEEEPVVASVE